MKNKLSEKLSGPISKRAIIVFMLVVIPLLLFEEIGGNNKFPSLWGLVSISFGLFLASSFLEATLRVKKDLDLGKVSDWKVKWAGSPAFSLILAILIFLASYALQSASENRWITLIPIILGSAIFYWQERIIMKAINVKESPLSLRTLRQ